MMRGLDQLFRDTFACLSIGAELTQRGETFPIRLLIRQPESWMALGEAEALSSRITGEILIKEVPEIFVGSTITVADRVYKIFQQPLKDPSETVWQIHGMMVKL